MFSYSCPFCSQRLLAQPERVGQRTICPKCLRPIVIPTQDKAETESPYIDHGFELPAVDVEDAVENSLSSFGSVSPSDVPEVQFRPEPPAVQFRPQPPSNPRPVPAAPAAAVTVAPPAAATATVAAPAPASAAAAQRPITPAVSHPTSPTPMPRPAPPHMPHVAHAPQSSHMPHAPHPQHAPRRNAVAQPRNNDIGRVSLHHPTGFASVDIAAELTAALTMRMKPPPDPPADLNLSTGGWLFMLLIGGGTWVAAVLSDERLLPFVAVVGALMLTFGYFWAAYLAGSRNWLRGIATLFPPIALFRLCRPFGDNGYRPLRFVLTGAMFIGLYFAGPMVVTKIQPLWTMLEIARPEKTPITTTTNVDRLRTAVQNSQHEATLNILADLAAPELIAATTPEEKASLITEITKLTRTDETDRPDIRVAAQNALILWSPKDTRLAVLNTLSAPQSQGVERRNAMRLATQWPDLEMAKAVAARLADRTEETQAKETLLDMPTSTVEAALIPLLQANDRILVLTVGDLLEKIGGPEALTVMAKMGQQDPHPTIRSEMNRHAEAIRTRLAKTGTTPDVKVAPKADTKTEPKAGVK